MHFGRHKARPLQLSSDCHPTPNHGTVKIEPKQDFGQQRVMLLFQCACTAGDISVQRTRLVKEMQMMPPQCRMAYISIVRRDHRRDGEYVPQLRTGQSHRKAIDANRFQREERKVRRVLYLSDNLVGRTFQIEGRVKSATIYPPNYGDR